MSVVRKIGNVILFVIFTGISGYSIIGGSLFFKHYLFKKNPISDINFIAACAFLLLLFLIVRSFVFTIKKGFFSGFRYSLAAAVLSILLVLSIPQCCGGDWRAIDNQIKSNLHHLYLTCEYFWNDRGSDKNCNASLASGLSVGFVLDPKVTISGGGTENTFIAKASHEESEKVYEVDAKGNIRELKNKQ